MSFLEGIKAIPGDIGSVPTGRGKLKRAAEIGKVLVDEALGVVRAIPYGVRALRLHRSLPDAVAGARDARGVRIVRDVRYASAPRAVMDVYLPDGASLANGAGAIADAVGGRGGGGGGGGDSDSSAFPVALFVHGGVWAVGEKWHFAPMASRLAEEGVIACVATYTLFPRAEADQMWREVSDAVGFTLENARGFGGDDARVSLIGHSAGAHVCSMALLHRCGVVSDDVGVGASADDPAARRMPKQFLGLCGVYDVGRHYEYEDSRGVALLSTMGRAMGGREKFPQCSPVRVVRGNRGAVGGEYAYDVEDPQARSIRWSPYDRVGENGPQTASHAKQKQKQKEKEEEKAKEETPWAAMAVLNDDDYLDVETIIAGRDKATESAAKKYRERAAAAAAAAANAAERAYKDATRAEKEREPLVRVVPGPPIGDLAGDGPAAMAGMTRSSSSATATANATTAERIETPPGRFPPTFLIAGCADVTVPWFESAEFHWALHDADVPSRVLLYLKENHVGFVLDWRPKPGASIRDEKADRDGDAAAAGASASASAPAAGETAPVALSAVGMGERASGGASGGGNGVAGGGIDDLGDHHRDILRLVKG